MKTLLVTLVSAIFSVSALAQQPARNGDPSAPKTRAEVKADLKAWLAAGYDPNNWWEYPMNAQRAGRIVAAQRAQAGGVQSQ